MLLLYAPLTLPQNEFSEKIFTTFFIPLIRLLLLPHTQKSNCFIYYNASPPQNFSITILIKSASFSGHTLKRATTYLSCHRIGLPSIVLLHPLWCNLFRDAIVKCILVGFTCTLEVALLFHCHRLLYNYKTKTLYVLFSVKKIYSFVRTLELFNGDYTLYSAVVSCL